MQPNLIARFEDLEARRNHLTARFLSLNPEQQQKYRGKGHSYAERIALLVYLEQHCAKSLAKTQSGKLAGKKVAAADAVAKLAEGLRVVAKQRHDMHDPRTVYSADQLVADWQYERAALRQYFSEASDENAGFLQLVMFGPIVSTSQLLTLMEAETGAVEQAFGEQSGDVPIAIS